MNLKYFEEELKLYMAEKKKRFRQLVPAEKLRRLVLAVVLGAILGSPTQGMAGPYLVSAHGNPNYGVNRSAIDSKYVDYATGNCGHCHEAHASLDGAEPAPANGPAAHLLFAASFNSSRAQGPYLESDDFCFYCHGDSGPHVTNQDYSANFGGEKGLAGPQSIMDAFNQASYHNLYDIWNFLSNNTNFSAWFARLGNPCSACHDSHLAKRNWDSTQTGFPLLSAISKPGVSGSLWGETQLMSAGQYLSGYEAPFSDQQASTREPAGIGYADGGNTPDYVGFCTTCHNQDTTIASTTLGRDLKKINWENTGLYQDKHGLLARDGTVYLREPYATAAATKSNFVLSCLDCHESHGSQNIMLLRRRINGEDLEGTVLSTDAMSYVCKRCHQDDLAAGAGTNQADRWEYVHHTASGAPYAESSCGDCHTSGDGSTPVACGNCHGHGMDDSWAGTHKTGRTTF